MSHHDVFISHSAKDKPVADAICAALEKEGVRCWIAPRDILPGQTWGGAIIDAISGSRALVLVFSSNANESQQVIREVERAVNKSIPVIPFKIDEVTPSKDLEFYIMTQHWLDAMTPPLEEHINTLCTTIKRLLGIKSTAEPAEPKPESPPSGESKAQEAVDKSLFEIKPPVKSAGFPVIKTASIAFGVLMLAIIIFFTFSQGEKAQDGGDIVIDESTNPNGNDPGTGDDGPWDIILETPSPTDNNQEYTFKTFPPSTSEPKPLEYDDPFKGFKLACTGKAVPSSTEGYQGEPLDVTVTIDHLIAGEITRVEIVSGCPKCVVTNLGNGVFETKAEWWGKGPVNFVFKAYDADGDERCTIDAPYMEALGEREGIVLEEPVGNCDAAASAIPISAYYADKVSLLLTFYDSIRDNVGQVIFNAPLCDNCIPSQGLIPGSYIYDFVMPNTSKPNITATYTAYDKNGFILCAGSWDPIKVLGFRPLDLTE